MQLDKQLMASLQATANKVATLAKELQSEGVPVKKITEINKELSRLQPIADKFYELQKMQREYEETIASMASERDPEMYELLTNEIKRIDSTYEKVENEARFMLLPKDPNDEKDVIVEMRAGAGGDESSIFVGDLFQVYKRYADTQGWKLSVTEAKVSEHGGFSTITFEISGKRVYSRMKFESGVHRVQRVPETEAKGRVHTSTITVAVLPEMDELDVKIDPKEIRIDVMRASGAGGQSVNKTESAVRLTHLPTNIVIYSQEEKSQNENKEKAFRVLRAKLWERAEQQREDELSVLRKSQIGTGDRSEKIRTYNYPQNRLTDHRIGMTINNLDAVMQGDIQQIIDAMQSHEQQMLMEAIAAQK